MSDIFDEMERLIDLSFTSKPYLQVSKDFWRPPTDIYETKDTIILCIEIAGVNKEDIDITFANDMLIVSGCRKPHVPPGVVAMNRIEMESGKFMKKLSFTIEIDRNAIEAEYHDGLLVITIPKRNNHD